MNSDGRPSLPEGCKPTKSVVPDHILQAIDCPNEMRRACIRYVRALNEFFANGHRRDEMWDNFCCENCPHWRLYCGDHLKGKIETVNGEKPKRKKKSQPVTENPMPKGNVEIEEMEIEEVEILVGYQVCVNGDPALPSQEIFERARRQAKSILPLVEGRVTIINLETGKEMEFS